MMKLIIMKIVALSSLPMIHSTPVIVKRGGVGDSQSGVRMTYYGSDYSQASNGKWIGDVPPYAPYGIGACGQEPVDKNFFVAMNSGAFSGTCGLCAKVTYGGNCVVAPIVDMCPGCGSGLDMSLHAFGQLVGGESRAKEMGVANVNYEIVRCPRNRAATGSSSFADRDPCSGASSGGAVSSLSGSSVSGSSSQSTTSPTATSAGSSTHTNTFGATTVTVTITESLSGGSTTTRTQTLNEASATGESVTGCGADGTLYGFPCCTFAAKVHDDWVDKNGYVYGWEDDTTCIVPK